MEQLIAADNGKMGGSSVYLAPAVVAVILLLAFYLAVASAGSNNRATLHTTTAPSTTSIPNNGIRTVANPGNLTMAQLSEYPECSQNYTYNTIINCGVGSVIEGNSTLILGSINADGTVTTYAYAITDALAPNERFAPTVQTYSKGGIMRDTCSIRLTVTAINYTRQYVSISVSHEVSYCQT